MGNAPGERCQVPGAVSHTSLERSQSLPLWGVHRDGEVTHSDVTWVVFGIPDATLRCQGKTSLGLWVAAGGAFMEDLSWPALCCVPEHQV